MKPSKLRAKEKRKAKRLRRKLRKLATCGRFTTLFAGSTSNATVATPATRLKFAAGARNSSRAMRSRSSRDR